jgi:hypothetical protein
MSRTKSNCQIYGASCVIETVKHLRKKVVR